MSSEPPTTLVDLRSLAPPAPAPPHPQPPHLAATPSSSTPTTTTITSAVGRVYRKGNWTLQETLVLIAAKKLDDERRLNAAAAAAEGRPSPSPYGRSAGGELRWKWVENYCYARGCLRSQNQCNDKWDNLLRDYKKVREYESRSRPPQPSDQDHDGRPSSSSSSSSYWTMEKHERKERGLPSNLAPELFEALNDVVQRKSRPPPPPPQQLSNLTPSSSPPPTTTATASPPPPPPVTSAAVSESSDSSETTGTETNDSDPIRKRKKGRSIGSSIARGASALARTLRSCEQKKEKRRRRAMELEERRLQVEERRTEVHRQGFAALVAAVNNLSGAIQSLISSDRRDNT